MRLMQTTEMARPPLSILSDDERLFHDAMYEFADREVRPLVRQMDEQAKIPRSLINALLRYGSEDIKHRYLPKLATAALGAYALSEAGSGSDAFAMAARAVDGGDHWAITGRKLWITNAGEADLFIVFANANPAAGYR